MKIFTQTIIKHENLPNFQAVAIEFHQNNQKWLLLGLYKPPNQITSDFIQNVSLILDSLLKNFKNRNLTLIRDFKLSVDVSLESFLQACKLTSLIIQALCFQSSNPSYIAKFGSFKERPWEKNYGSYKSFNIETFKKTVSDKMPWVESNSYSEFEMAFLTVINK